MSDIRTRVASAPARGGDVNRSREVAEQCKRGICELRLQLRMKRSCSRDGSAKEILVGRSMVLECRTPAAVRLVRARLAALMKELDGISVVEDDVVGDDEHAEK
jgi:hypothetical protein